MSADSNLPDDIMDAVKTIQEARGKTYLSRPERENLNRARLRIAYWACRNENIIASRENLAYILGADAPDIMRAYEKYLEKDKEGKKGGSKPSRKGDNTKFWGNA